MGDERPATAPPIITFPEGLADRIEYVHTEVKGLRSESTRNHDELQKRVARLEFQNEKTDDRLKGGAESFAQLRQSIEKVNQKIDWPWWKVLATVAPAILLIITWVWQAARYPDEEKFEAFKNATTTKFEGLASQVQEQKLQLVKQDGTLDRIENSQSDLNKKIDAVLLMRQGQP